MKRKIDEFIKLHKNWKLTLSDYIVSSTKKMRPESCHERCCEMTNWLLGEEAKNLFSSKDLVELQKAHKVFHHNVAELILNSNRGVSISEEMALGIDSPFHRNTENLCRILSKAKIDKSAA